MKRLLLQNFVTLSLLVTCSCTSLKQIDVPVCVELNPDRAYCTTIISNKGFYVDDENLLDGKTWWEYKVEMIQVPPTSYEEIKKYLLRQCERIKRCKGELDEASFNNINGLINVKYSQGRD